MLRRCNFQILAALVAACVFMGASARPALAIGHYNLPGSFCQCFGYGNGAGHHACLLLGPKSCEGFCATHEVRLECPPQPPYGYYGCGPCNSITHGSWLNDGVQIQAPATEPTPAPAPGPTTARPQVHRGPQIW